MSSLVGGILTEPAHRTIITLTVISLILWRMPKVRTLLAMIVHATIAAALIKIDQFMPLPVHFPRTPAELLDRPNRVLRLLVEWLAPAEGQRRWRLEHAGMAATVLEPDKAPLRAPLCLCDEGVEEPLMHLFCKSGDARSRGLPLWLTALASFSGNREVFFYRCVRALLPHIDAPRALLAAEASLLGRWCLVLTDMCPGGALPYDRDAATAADASTSTPSPPQRKPARGIQRRQRSPARSTASAVALAPPRAAHQAYVVPDRVGCTLAQAHAVMRGLARLHATFWGRAHTEPALRPLTAPRSGSGARGYVAAPAVGLLLGRTLQKLPRLAALWRTLGCALADCPATLLHGDCRPENLLFHDTAAEAEAAATEAAAAEAATGGARGAAVTATGGTWRVTFLDWEAVGVNPAANDLIYFLVVGLRAADSAAWEAALLRAYHSELLAELRRQHGDGKSSRCDGGSDYPLAALRGHVALLGCVLLVVQVRCRRTHAASVARARTDRRRRRMPSGIETPDRRPLSAGPTK